MITFTAVDSAADVVTIGIVLLALYYIVRQKILRIFDAKVALAAVYVAFLGGMTLELLRDFTTDPVTITSYSFAEVGLILSIVTLLTWTAQVFYVRPGEPSFTERLGALFGARLRRHGIVLLAMAAYFIFLWVYLVAVRPFKVVDVSIAGESFAVARYDPVYLILLSFVLAAYLFYTLPLFLLAEGRTQDRDVRRAMVVLPISWTVIGATLLLFNGLLFTAGLNGITIGHIVLAATFAMTTMIFRKVTLLGDIFEPMKLAIPATNPFTNVLGIESSFIQGKSILLEFDPSLDYDQVVKDFAIEQISHTNFVFVFTFAASPVLATLSAIPEVRFYVTTSSVSHPQPTSEPYKVLIPERDSAVMLDLVDKTVSAKPGSNVTLIFDSISDLVLHAGSEGTIRVLKQMLESLGGWRVTSLFLVIPKAHDKRFVNFIKGIFEHLLSYDSTGLRFVR